LSRWGLSRWGLVRVQHWWWIGLLLEFIKLKWGWRRKFVLLWVFFRKTCDCWYI
jgi:hypothetical protein